MSIRRLVYAAAHAGFPVEAPLGGGAAVARMLEAEWRRTRPFELEMLTPAVLGPAAPAGHELASYDERGYAAFCRAFSEAATRRILACDPRTTAVLVNDISEAPDFAALGRAGFRITTIYHVDVVAYIAAIYLRGLAAPRRLAAAWRRIESLGLGRFAPLILRLIFERQRQSLLHSAAVVVPSAGMKRLLLESWPEAREDRIHVVPWGAPPAEAAASARDVDALRREFGVGPEERVLLTLSRISPEKGQDLLLESLLDWERARAVSVPPVRLFVCGAPAYMQGRAHMRKLGRLAARLKRIRVEFPGHVTGARKQAFFALADLFVAPSRHESYGLTLMEALAAGLPAVALASDGAREIVRPEFAVMVPRGAARGELWRAVEQLLSDQARRAAMAAAARAFAAERPFSLAAARLAEICAG